MAAVTRFDHRKELSAYPNLGFVYSTGNPNAPMSPKEQFYGDEDLFPLEPHAARF